MGSDWRLMLGLAHCLVGGDSKGILYIMLNLKQRQARS